MESICIDREGPAARLRIDRASSLNAVSPTMLASLTEACEGLAGDDSVSVVTLEGEGGSFCAGADLPAFERALVTSPQETSEVGLRASEALAGLPQITIASVRGHCIGAGVVLAAACDIRIAADDSRFWIPELDAGIPFGWGGWAHLIRLVGESVATDMVLTARPLGASEALTAGLVSRVVPTAELESEMDRVIDAVARKPSLVLRMSKSQLLAVRAGSFDPRDDSRALLEAIQDEETGAVLRAYAKRLG